MTHTRWPALPDPAVFHGPAGEFVLRTEPHTESDPMALLSQFVVAFGTAAGAGAHYAVEASRHTATSSSCSWARVQRDGRAWHGITSRR